MTIFKGYSGCSSDEELSDSFEVVMPFQDENFYQVIYCNESNKDGNLDAKLAFEGNMTSGGFKVFTDTNDDDLLDMDWQDALNFEFNDQLQTVLIDAISIKFVNEDNYRQFIQMVDENAPN